MPLLVTSLMFNIPTAFVLGAGVSVPHGFPSGVGLIDAICKHDTDRTNKLIAVLKIADQGRSESFIKEFFEALSESGLYSIDAWLEGNPKYMGLGKCAIAALIWEAEHKAVIKPVDDSDNWFRWLWNRMYHPDINELAKNTVSFITFNYDRFFEYKLTQHINSTYKERSDEERDKAFQAIRAKIIHVHGALQSYGTDYSQIGRFWKGHFGLTDRHQPESIDALGKAIAYLSKTINIVCENAGDEKQVETARQWLLDSKKRVFLGFGYDKRNLARLGVKKLVESGVSPAGGTEVDIVDYPIVGTAYKLKLGEQLTAKDLFAHRIHFGENDFNAVRFCKKYLKV